MAADGSTEIQIDVPSGRVTAIGREIKWAGQNASLAEHPGDGRLSGCYGTMIYGRLRAGQVFTHDSIIGTRFAASIPSVIIEDGRESINTEVTGRAYRTGEHRFYLDLRDDLGTGFVLR